MNTNERELSRRALVLDEEPKTDDDAIVSSESPPSDLDSSRERQLQRGTSLGPEHQACGRSPTPILVFPSSSLEGLNYKKRFRLVHPKYRCLTVNIRQPIIQGDIAAPVDFQAILPCFACLVGSGGQLVMEAS
jgi:hypothetical protein